MTIEALKQQGHELLEEYILLVKRSGLKSRREVAYEDLKTKMHGRNPHFGQMKTKAEVMLAIGSLKKMIYAKSSCKTTS